jgi:hypothetical protein
MPILQNSKTQLAQFMQYMNDRFWVESGHLAKSALSNNSRLFWGIFGNISKKLEQPLLWFFVVW